MSTYSKSDASLAAKDHPGLSETPSILPYKTLGYNRCSNSRRSLPEVGGLTAWWSASLGSLTQGTENLTQDKIHTCSRAAGEIFCQVARKQYLYGNCVLVHISLLRPRRLPRPHRVSPNDRPYLDRLSMTVWRVWQSQSGPYSNIVCWCINHNQVMGPHRDSPAWCSICESGRCQNLTRAPRPKD